MTEIKDEQLLNLIIAADDEELAQGVPPKARSLGVTSRVMRRLGYTGFVLAGVSAPPIVRKISDLHGSLYRPSDLAIGGIHGGIFMFRDIFARIYVPIGYGKIGIDPFKLCDLSEMQMRWLASNQNELSVYMDQFTDIFDFGAALGNYADYKLPPKGSLELMHLAAFQFQAAAATLSVAFDFRGAIQSALIGTELALKGGLTAIGVDEKARRKHGHDLASAANAFALKMSNFDIDRVLRTLTRLPPYVENRYSPEQPSRVETGHIVMGAQYVAGEVMRQISGYSIRSAAKTPSKRTYPQ